MNATNQPPSLRNQFLIAMPFMDSSGFAQTVTYVCEHDEQGAMGIIINRSTEISLAEIFAQLNIEANRNSDSLAPIYAGGPVQTNRGFILHTDKRPWESTLDVTNDIRLSTSKDILTSIAENNGPQDCLVALGYAGWSPGQLEQELADNCWLTVPAKSEIIFDTPCEQRLDAAAALLGINLDQISRDTGHA